MAEMIKTQLGKKKTVADGMIQTRQQKIQEIQNSVEASRTDAGMALSRNMHVMSAVVEYIKRCQAQLNEVIETKHFSKMMHTDSFKIWRSKFWSHDQAGDHRQERNGKQVAGGGRMTNLPNIPQRFAWGAPNVLAKEGFSSGKFYYEVQVKDRTQWKLGVVKQSVNRKGEKRLVPQTGYWMIWLKGEGQFIATEDPWVDLHKRETLQKVGIFVDCEAGQVSFYDVDARVKIFTFTGYYFAEKLSPFFSLCSDTCKNSTPLIIAPVKYA
ncbi:E3 ubiquitin-protein ligase TRIM21-like [Solea senegalensis]|uniref:E3 ubiquitin-protein ligase TRIM21-like n=1 Tax=Solea senegalensis TaxID=28829 RepID=A0AAV6SKI6_SOLSE|nr:E3 ubiquitin-protein ligase TRIM21-like [Solea senegalensis]